MTSNWKKEWEKIKCFATQAGQSVGFENNKDIKFISTQIEKAKQEERNRILDIIDSKEFTEFGYSFELKRLKVLINSNNLI